MQNIYIKVKKETKNLLQTFTLNGKMLRAFPLRWGMRRERHLSQLTFSTIAEILVTKQNKKKEKKMNGRRTEK